ncbi:hypothetical protein QLX08_004414 [Tetragonisca angustula]|uniref:Uncharacterized protein n=1 Tax=Tetragonisca angustula TaxID=166442 RepID=A0AAW1A2I1_9HYME
MAKLGPGSRDAGGGSSGGRGHVGQQEAHGKDGADNEGKKEVGQYRERVMREGTKQDNGGRGQVYRGDLDANERTVRGIVRYKTRLH